MTLKINKKESLASILQAFGVLTIKSALFAGAPQSLLPIFFEGISEIPLAHLRANERPAIYVLLSAIHLLFRMGLNIYIVVFLQREIEGVLMGNIIAVILFWGSLLAVTVKKARFSCRDANLPALLKYSAPLVLAALPGLLIKNADKIVLASVRHRTWEQTAQAYREVYRRALEGINPYVNL